MAKVVRDGPESIAGKAFTRLIDVQGTCSWAQQQCGWNTSILEDFNSRLPQFKARWLKAL
eukprot:1994043-Ditylum_brightwellii.AAC.1